jgi:hypothetical protein
MKTLFFICLLFSSLLSNAQTNEYTKPVENTLQTYQSMSTDQILKLKEDANNEALNRARKETANFLEYYNSIKSFKPITRGGYDAKIIFNSEMIIDGKVFVNNNRIFEVDVAGNILAEINGLKVNSDVVNGHTKVFYDSKGNYVPIDVYILAAFQ